MHRRCDAYLNRLLESERVLAIVVSTFDRCRSMNTGRHGMTNANRETQTPQEHLYPFPYQTLQVAAAFVPDAIAGVV